jgi:Uncharacterised nucleotidyltransferase
MRNGGFADLVRVVAEPTAASVQGLDDAGLAELVGHAVDHRVAGSLEMALVDAGITIPTALVDASATATITHLQTVRALSRIRTALGEAGVRWAVVKGPAIARRWPRHTNARTYHDLDLLVDPSSLGAAAAALVEVGFAHRNRNWSGFRRLGVGELPLDDGVTVLDLHWHLIGLAPQRRDLRLHTAGMLDRAVQIEIGGVTVLTLDDADTLVHLCCHDALAGAQSLVQLRDVHLVAGDVPLALGRRRLVEAGAGRLGGVVLDRAERVFGPVRTRPVAVAMSGAPWWIRANRLVDRSWDLWVRHPWTPFPGALTQAGRATVPATGRAVLAQLDEAVRIRTGRPTVVSPGGPLDWSVDAGGAAEYERYLADVAAGRFGV